MFSNRLLAIARSSGLALTLTILLSWAGGLLSILQAWVLASIVNAVFLLGLTRASLAVPLGILLAVAVGKALSIWAAEVSANIVAQRVKTKLRDQLLNHLAALGPSFTQDERTGELATAAVEGVEALDAYFSQYLPQLVLAASIPLSILILIFPIDTLTGVVFLLTAPLVPFFMILIGKSSQALTERQYTMLSRLSAHFYDVLQGLRTLKALGQARSQAGVIANVSERYREVTMQVLRVTFLSALALELLTTLSTAIVAVEIGIRLLYGKLEFLPAFFILVVAPDFYLPLRQLGLKYHAGMSGTSAAKRIFEILDTPLQEGQSEVTAGMDSPQQQGGLPDFQLKKGEIAFERVRFQYPGREKPALDDVSFAVPVGKLTALVGATGAGKSTIAKLLLRFNEPDAGHILVDDRPLTSIRPEEWRKLVAWVPQTPYLFQDSLAANLRLAKPDASEEEMMQACQQAGLLEFISTLPGGFKAQVGERGARLSGGQAQRLALARAFLKNAPFLLLDEPTSSLDPGLEAELRESVQRLVKERTALVIAHRLSTVYQADQIIVLEAGRVVETGQHSELMAQKGRYAALVKNEAQTRRPENPVSTAAGSSRPGFNTNRAESA
jgi:ATP-binding cassette subfamily C protein CydD